MIGFLATVLFAVVVVVVCEMAEDRGIRIPVLEPVARLVDSVIWWLLRFSVPLVGLAIVVLGFEPRGVVLAAVVCGWAAVGAAPAVVRFARSAAPRGGEATARHLDRLHRDGWQRLRQRDYEHAATAYQEAAELGDADAMVNLANLLSDELGEPVAAEHWYRRAVDAGSAIAAENLGLMCTDQGRLDDARELFRLATERGSTGGYAGLAKIEVDRGEFERARVLLEIALMEHDVYAYAPLGEVLLLMDRAQEAEDRLREGTDRGAPGAATVLAWLLRETGREDEAAALRGRIDLEAAQSWPPPAP